MRAGLTIASLVLLACAAEARELTLTEAITLAKAHSHEIARAEFNRSSAEKLYAAAGAERMPTLSNNSTANYVNEVSHLSIALPGNSIERDLGSKETYLTDFRLTVPLWTGGRIGSSVAMANAQEQYAQELAQVETDKVIYQTRLEYFNLQAGEKGIEVAEASLKRAQIIQRDVQSLFEAGSADSVNIIEAALAVVTAEHAVTQTKNSRRLSEIRLLSLCGLPLEESIGIADRMQSADSLSRLATQLSPVVSERAEIKAATNAIEIQRKRLGLAKSDWYPTLAGYGGYSYGKPNLDRFGNSWNDYWTAGATLNWSINLGGKTKYRTAAVRFDIEASQQEQARIEEQVSREVALAIERVRLAASRLATERIRLNLSSENFRLAQGQQREGSLSSNRLLEIETKLTESSLATAAAEVELYAAWSAYLYAIGSPQLKEGL